jgi:hypothetical protein
MFPLAVSVRVRGEKGMDIRFVSTLTAEDENSFAPALLRAIASLLDQMPIAYTVRIETTGAQVLQHSHPAFEAPSASAISATTYSLTKS